MVVDFLVCTPWNIGVRCRGRTLVTENASTVHAATMKTKLQTTIKGVHVERLAACRDDMVGRVYDREVRVRARERG